MIDLQSLIMDLFGAQSGFKTSGFGAPQNTGFIQDVTSFGGVGEPAGVGQPAIGLDQILKLLPMLGIGGVGGGIGGGQQQRQRAQPQQFQKFNFGSPFQHGPPDTQNILGLLSAFRR